MDVRHRGRFWLESALGGLSGTLALATLIHKDWIEEVFHVDPDGAQRLRSSGRSWPCCLLRRSAWDWRRDAT